MPVAVAALTLVASLALTYVFCIRPMRNGSHCGGCPPSPSQPGHKKASGVTSAQVQAAVDELAALRAQTAHQSDPTADGEQGRPTPVMTPSAADGH